MAGSNGATATAEIPRELLAAIKPRMLALAAEVAGKIRAADGGGPGGPGDNQFRALVHLCREADIPEELAMYLRYQAGRKAPGSERWRPADTQAMLGALQQLEEEAKERHLPSTPASLLTLYAFFFGYVYWNVKAVGAGGASRGRRP